MTTERKHTLQRRGYLPLDFRADAILEALCATLEPMTNQRYIVGPNDHPIIRDPRDIAPLEGNSIATMQKPECFLVSPIDESTDEEVGRVLGERVLNLAKQRPEQAIFFFSGELPYGMDVIRSSDDEKKVMIRFMRAYDIMEDKFIERADVIVGFGAVGQAVEGAL